MSDTKWMPEGLEAMDAALERLAGELPSVGRNELGLAVLNAVKSVRTPLRVDALVAAVWSNYGPPEPRK